MLEEIEEALKKIKKEVGKDRYRYTEIVYNGVFYRRDEKTGKFEPVAVVKEEEDETT